MLNYFINFYDRGRHLFLLRPDLHSLVPSSFICASSSSAHLSISGRQKRLVKGTTPLGKLQLLKFSSKQWPAKP